MTEWVCHRHPTSATAWDCRPWIIGPAQLAPRWTCAGVVPAERWSPVRCRKILSQASPRMKLNTSMSKTQTKTQVLIVDDHPMVRDWLAQMIRREPDLAVCGEASDAAGALRAIATL